jgi:hypothetical protein
MALTQRSGRFLGWHHSESVAAGATGNAVVVPPLAAGQRVTVTVKAGTTGGYCQYTTSSDAEIAAGTATWQTWPAGQITGTLSDALIAPVTGLRFVAAALDTPAITGEIVIT